MIVKPSLTLDEFNATGDLNTHTHKKYTFQITSTSSLRIYLPAGEFYYATVDYAFGHANSNYLLVYLNGVLQSNGINFIEILDPNDSTKGIGIGIDFNYNLDVNDMDGLPLHVNDIVVMEWIM